ncbi:MAG: SigE family RNA polymerase sigma factor [Actinomycetota bacterium]|nr:SigE family RNA polymerase sigma factor [Actinomycetota bacterium]
MIEEETQPGTDTQGTKARPSSRLAELYKRNAPDALRLAYVLTGDRALAEDFVQEAFVKLAGRFVDLRNPAAFPAYLRKTVVNLARMHWRRRRIERELMERRAREPRLEAGPAADAGMGARDAMRRALLGLPPRTRAALALRCYEDLQEAQVAEILGCSVGTVKSLVSRGVAALRGTVDRDGGGESTDG